MRQRGVQITKWLLRSQDEVLDKFAHLNGAIQTGESNTRCVFVNGHRKDKVLIIAHADTVWKERPQIGCHPSGVLYSRSSSYGIGADDRAGCAMAWSFRKMGHSILITSGEESFGLGANEFIKTHMGVINEHMFAVELDRSGSNDAVFYDCGSPEFVKYVTDRTELKHTFGSFTDICILCKSICGVNVSVGYDMEHTPQEMLDMHQWYNIKYRLYSWLSQRQKKFTLDTVAKTNGYTRPPYPNEELYFCSLCNSFVEQDEFNELMNSCKKCCGILYEEMSKAWCDRKLQHHTRTNTSIMPDSIK